MVISRSLEFPEITGHATALLDKRLFVSFPPTLSSPAQYRQLRTFYRLQIYGIPHKCPNRAERKIIF